MSEFLVMFGTDTKQSKSVSREAVNSQTEPNSPRNEARHSPITDKTPNTVWECLREAWCLKVMSRSGAAPRQAGQRGDSGVVRFAVFAKFLVGKISESKVFSKT